MFMFQVNLINECDWLCWGGVGGHWECVEVQKQPLTHLRKCPKACMDAPEILSLAVKDMFAFPVPSISKRHLFLPACSLEMLQLVVCGVKSLLIVSTKGICKLSVPLLCCQ